MATIKKWDNLFHELHFETYKEEILNFALNWMLEKIKA